MKNLKLKTKILLVAFLLGSGGALATTISNKPADDEPRYDWNGPGHPDLPNETVNAAIDHFGCSVGNTLCAIGERVGGGSPVQLMKP